MIIRLRLQACWLIIAFTLTACATPNINSLNPNTGPERSLVEIDGDNFLSSAYWDAGTASEQNLQLLVAGLFRANDQNSLFDFFGIAASL